MRDGVTREVAMQTRFVCIPASPTKHACGTDPAQRSPKMGARFGKACDHAGRQRRDRRIPVEDIR